MSVYMPMSTTVRHNKITGTIFSAIVDLLRKNEVYATHEECALVHWGFKRKNDFTYLVDIPSIDDINYFTNITINELDYVLPDFILFKENPYLCNNRETKIAGCPDLIIEVWSDSNSTEERNFKLGLYSSSPIVEHWYIDQDSNEIICYIGDNKAENQSLHNILETSNGLKFDLRYLAI